MIQEWQLFNETSVLTHSMIQAYHNKIIQTGATIQRYKRRNHSMMNDKQPSS